MTTLVKDALVITVNAQDDVYRKGYLLIEDDKILEVGSGEYCGPVQPQRVISAAGKALLPGVVDVHTHVCGSLYKAMTEDVRGAFYGLALPMEDLLTSENTYTLSMLGALECLKGGVTCINDIYHYMAATARAVQDMHMRGVLAHKILERNLSRIYLKDYTLLPAMGEKKLQENIDLIEEFHGKNRIICKFGPHATDTISPDLAKKIKDLGEKYNVGYHIHVAQKVEEINFLKSEYNLTPVEYLEETGLLCEKTTAAHCVLVDDHDMEMLGRGGLTVAHCGEMTAKRGQYPPMDGFIRHGVKFCIGTDWVTMDPWTAARFTLIADRVAGCTLEEVNAHTALRKITIEPAIHLGLGDQIGSLEVGKQADFILMDLQSANLMPMADDPIATIIYNANRHDVTDVWIGGEELIRDRELLIADEKKILSDGQKTSEEIWAQYRAQKNN